jgi:hypothetical protein
MREEISMNDRTLGNIAMICAPALLVEALLTGGGERPLVIGLASMVFMAGWICSNTVMRRTRAAGTGGWGRAVLLVQLVGLVLACLFGFFEATGLLGRDDLAFNVMDAAWPLSMLWMLVVGVTVVFAGRMPGWRRFAPLLCGLWLPLGIPLQAVLGGQTGSIMFGVSAVFWVLLGYAVRGGRTVQAPEPAVQ